MMARRVMLCSLKCATFCLCMFASFLGSSAFIPSPLCRTSVQGAGFFCGSRLRAARLSGCRNTFLPHPLREPERRPGLRMATDEPQQDEDKFPSMKTVEYYSDEGDMEETSEARSLGRVEEIGLFPLGLVLNPGATLPLHIFEMRYRQLFNSAWDGNQKMGIVMYDKEKNKWARVGTQARVVRFQPLPDGRILTVNEGEERFRVLKVTRAGSSKDYMKALVEYVDDDAAEPTALAELEREVWASLQDVLSLSNSLYGKALDLKDSIKKLAPLSDADKSSGQSEEEEEEEEVSASGEKSGEEDEDEENFSGARGGGQVQTRSTLRGTAEGVVRVEEGGDKKLTEAERQRLFSFAVSQVLDMPLEDQQLMLQSTVTEERLRKQVALLSQARQYLAAQVALKNAFGKSLE